MADPNAPDPAAAIREMLGEWQKLSNDVATEALRSAEFGRAIDQAGALSIAAQQTYGEAIGRVLTGMNLPNRAEILEIGARITAIDARLERIEALLLGMNATPAVRAATPRTRRPPVG